jgi:hypothetical protein
MTEILTVGILLRDNFKPLLEDDSPKCNIQKGEIVIELSRKEDYYPDHNYLNPDVILFKLVY